MYILDTDHLNLFQLGEGREYQRFMSQIGGQKRDRLFVTIVSFHEQVSGWFIYLNRAKGLEGLIKAYAKFEVQIADFAQLNVLPFDQRAKCITRSGRKKSESGRWICVSRQSRQQMTSPCSPATQLISNVFPA